MVEALDCRRHVRTWPESTPPQNNHTYQPCSALQPIHGPPVWILSQRFLVLGLLLWFSFVVVWSIFKRVASEWGKLFFIMWMASSNQLIEGLKRKKNGGSPRKKKKKQLPPNCCWTWAMASVLPWVPSLLGCPGDTGCANCHHKANSGRRMGRLTNSSYGRDWRQTHRWGLDVYMNVHMYVFTFSIDCSFPGEPGYQRLTQGLAWSSPQSKAPEFCFQVTSNAPWAQPILLEKFLKSS